MAITCRGEKCRTDETGGVAKGWDHDPPAKQKAVPLGILVLVSGVLSLFFGSGGSSDFWVDALQCWWQRVRSQWRGIKRLVVYLDNGPDNSGRRTQFLKRMVEFADWSGLVVRLVYYPPYHSKYNPIEHCWSSLQRKWNGQLLNCWEVILSAAQSDEMERESSGGRASGGQLCEPRTRLCQGDEGMECPAAAFGNLAQV